MPPKRKAAPASRTKPAPKVRKLVNDEAPPARSLRRIEASVEVDMLGDSDADSDSSSSSASSRRIEASVEVDMLGDSDADSDSSSSSASESEGESKESLVRGRGIVEARVEVEMINSDEDSSDEGVEEIVTRAAKKKASGRATRTTRASIDVAPVRGSHPAVLNTRERSRKSDNVDYIVAEKRKASRLPPVPVERISTIVTSNTSNPNSKCNSNSNSNSNSDDYDSSEEDDLTWVSDISITSSVNAYTKTAIDDEQIISYAFDSGILSQYRKACILIASMVTPCFITIALLCYLIAIITDNMIYAEQGVVMILVLIVTLLLALSLGLPLVLLQRIVSSLSTGKNAELEMICLALSIIVMGCVSMTYNALRGNKCGILWCEGNKNI
jgi:hypothetical protein